MATLPFTWGQFERETGREVSPALRRRITACAKAPTAKTWANARSIVVAPQMSYMGQTLWQCVQAIAMRPFPDGEVPDQGTVIRAMCYAAGLPCPPQYR